jgi:FMN phosphatase YigB (HAD superfamily)
MVEDTLPNLKTAKRLGMKTVWVSGARASRPGSTCGWFRFSICRAISPGSVARPIHRHDSAGVTFFSR